MNTKILDEVKMGDPVLFGYSVMELVGRVIDINKISKEITISGVETCCNFKNKSTFVIGRIDSLRILTDDEFSKHTADEPAFKDEIKTNA